jgi:hypothetical protein
VPSQKIVPCSVTPPKPDPAGMAGKQCRPRVAKAQEQRRVGSGTQISSKLLVFGLFLQEPLRDTHPGQGLAQGCG